MDKRAGFVVKDAQGNVIEERFGLNNHSDAVGHAKHTMNTNRIFHSRNGETATVYRDGKPVITIHKF